MLKKFFALLIVILYGLSSNCCFAFSELYYIKNVKKDDMIKQAEDILAEKEYSIKNKNSVYSVYAVSSKNPEKYASIVLQQSGQNLFYYFDSDKSGKKLNKLFLKNLKKQDIVYEQSENETHLTNFANIVQKTKTGETKTYSFEQPSKNISTITPSVKNTAETTTLKGFVGKIEKGTMLDVYLQTAINTATAKEGDRVVAVLKNDWVYNGCVVAEQGSILEGSLTQASPAKVASRNGSVQIVFTRLVTPKGKVYELSTEEIDFKVTNEGKIQRIALKTLVWSAVGGLVGLALAAIFSGSDSLVKGAVIGASVAGGTALVSSTAERGVDAEIPSFTDLEVKLSKPLNVVLSY